MKDVSILIVHYNTPRLLRQTLKAIRRAAPKLAYEVIVADNNPACRVHGAVRAQFPEVRTLICDRNLGFAGGMNAAAASAEGRYLFIYNPDAILLPGTLEELVAFMDANPDAGLCGPQLLHPDGSVQSSAYRFMRPATILSRRLPFLRRLPSVRKHMEEYLMADWDHADTRDVDYLLGAALLVRRDAFDRLGGFDDGYFMYFEDQDLCRRAWKAGMRVVYHPAAKAIHYHRRETAQGGLVAQLRNPLTRIQLRSALYYYRKFNGEDDPHDAFRRLSPPR